MGWERICYVTDVPEGGIVLWRRGSGLGLSLGLSIGYGDVIDLPMAELRAALMDSLIAGVFERLEQIDGADLMMVIVEGLSSADTTDCDRTSGKVLPDTGSQELSP